MDENIFKEKINEAIYIVNDSETHKKFMEFGELEETYKQIAFKEILHRLLYSHTAYPQEPLEKEPENITAPKYAKKSLEEFYGETHPKNHSEIIISFAYYFYKYGEKKSFNRKDIEDCYSKVLIAKPANISDLVNLHRKKGRIMLAEEKKGRRMTFAITRKGIEYVENSFKENKK